MTTKKQMGLRIAPGEQPFSTLLRAFSDRDPVYDEGVLSSAKEVDEIVDVALSGLDKLPAEQHANFAAEVALQHMLTVFLQMQEISLSRLRLIKQGLEMAELDEVLRVVDAMDGLIVAQCVSVIRNMKEALGDSSTSGTGTEPSGITLH